MPSTMTPNMSLTLPSVGTEPGPAYATDINSSLSTVDQHDHTSGNGVPVPSAGLNINTDLPFGNNNLTLVRSVRLNPQGSPLSLGTDLGCLYESGVDLYYNDGNGNQIRITASGSVAGATGSITGLTSPASASYSAGSQTFTWQSNSNVAANMDFRSAILRNNSVSSNGITLAAPSSLPGNYSLTLPSALPGAQSFMSLDSSGNIAANWTVDNSTIIISSNLVQIGTLPTNSVGTSQIVNAAVTGVKLQNNIAIPGNPTLQGGSFFIPAQAAENPLMILRGTVSSTGTIQQGGGFSVSHPGTGSYTLTWSTAFSGTPTMVVSSDNNSQPNVLVQYDSSGMSTTGGKVQAHNPTGGSALDCSFSFIAIGLR